MEKKLLFQQVKEWILEKIQDGTFKTGAIIPSDTELVSMFGVSRATVTRALTELVHDGYLKRVQGKGTFVQKDKRLSRTKVGSLGFIEEMALEGKKVETKALNIEIIQDKTLASLLKVNPNSQIVKYERLRVMDGIVVANQVSYVPNKFLLFPKTISINDLPSIELYEVLKEKGYEVKRATEVYTVSCKMEENIIDIMQLQPNEPTLRVKRWSRLSDDTLLEYVESFLRWDYYQIEMELDS